MKVPKIANVATDLAALCELHSTQTPNAEFVGIDGKMISFIESYRIMRQFQSMISSEGLVCGDRVGYGFANSPLSALAILGIISGGYLATAINLVAGNTVLKYVLDHAKVKLLLVDQGGEELLAPILKNLPYPPKMIRIERFEEYPIIEQAKRPNITPETQGLLMYTSGTTGKPKGVLLSHKNLIAGGRNVAHAHQLNADDRALCILPLYHINGLCVTLMAPLFSGGSVALPSKFSVTKFWNTIIENHCSWFSCVPTQVSYLLHAEEGINSKNYPRLRFARSASSALAPDVHTNFEKRFGIPMIETMGITEASAQILSNPLPPKERRIGSPGIAMGNKVMIVDSFARECAKGVEGEIMVQGDNVMLGYLDNPEATQQSLSEEGWFRTGDLGKMDDDGYIFVTGRLKELIIKGGENIAPREIDEALYTHAEVIEAAAFARPCEQYGQRVEAAVVLRDGAKVTAQDLQKICLGQLGVFKTPDVVHILDDLPKGPSGKIQRRLLEESL